MRHISKVVAFVFMAVALLAGSVALSAQTSTAPDNTRINKRDRNDGAVTADQQRQNSSDVEITRKIRSSITKEKGLSTYAKNIKIITQSGNVTLKGPVRSEEDKRAIEAKAIEVAGAGHVKNDIDIVAKQAGKKVQQ